MKSNITSSMNIKFSLFISAMLIVLAANPAFSQTTEFVFKPQWKEGEKKTIKIATTEIETKNGKKDSDTTYYTVYEIEVVKDNPDHYLIKVTSENSALKSAMSLYNDLGTELRDYKSLVFDVKVNKADGKPEIVNWQQIQTTMNNTFQKVEDLLAEKESEVGSLISLIFMPMKELYKDKETITSGMLQEVGFLFTPFGKKFIPGDTLVTVDRSANPFNPMDTISMSTLVYLTDADEKNSVCSVNSKLVYDLTEFKKMMVEMMKGFAEAFDAKGESMEKAEKEINSIEFDMDNIETITFNYQSSWPLKVVRTATVKVSEGKKKTEKNVISTVSLN